jgi:hydrogenase nickel incorporation protein HypB
VKQITLKKNVLENNDEIAKVNKKLLDAKGIFTINLLGSPGAGKTSILEQLIKGVKDEISMAVIEGDLYTTKDAERIEAHEVPVIQVNTGGACHLDASMIREAISNLQIDDIKFLVIENVGNLVCPASYDLSEDIKVTALSITEGNDKPLKYPSMFQKSEIVIVNKIDLLQFTNFSMEELYKDLKSLRPDVKVFQVSCTTGEGFKELTEYIIKRINEKGGI